MRIRFKKSTMLVFAISAFGVGGCSTTCLESDGTLAYLWSKYSAEARALYYQAYNVAKDRLDSAVATNSGASKLAVIVDIDETVLDNTPFEADLVKTHQRYSTNLWDNWSHKANAEHLPG